MHKGIIIAISLLLMLNSAYSQDNKKELVSVNVDIVGKGAPSVCVYADTLDYYFVTVDVLNTQDTTVSLWVLTCSWPMESFVSNTDYVVFTFCFSGCDHNIPDRIDMPAKKSVRFYGTIYSRKKSSSIPRIKLGLRFFRSFNEIWSFGDTKKSFRQIKIAWSNEVELKDNMYSYQLK